MGLFDGTPLERPVRCERCGVEVGDCRCPPEAAAPLDPGKQDVHVRRERRRGKWTTLIAGFDGNPADRKALLKQLQAGLGVGGGLAGDELLLQGDHRDAVVARLIELGYRAKPAGG